MSGPHCRTCKHFIKIPFTKDVGECFDPTKIIFFGKGDRFHKEPEVYESCECMNHSEHPTEQGE